MKNRLFFRLLILAVATVFTVTSCKDYDDDITSLDKKISELSTRIPADKSAQIEELGKEIQKHKAEFEAAKKNLVDVANAIKDTQDKVANSASKAELETLKKSLEAAKKEVLEKAIQVEAFENYKKVQEDALAEINKAIKDLSEAPNVTKEELDKELAKLNAMYATKAKMEENVATLNALIKTLNGDVESLKGLTGKVDVLEGKAAELGTSVSELEKALKAINVESLGLDKEIEKIKQNAADIVAIRTTLNELKNAPKFDKDGFKVELKGEIKTEYENAINSAISELESKLGTDITTAVNNLKTELEGKIDNVIEELGKKLTAEEVQSKIDDALSTFEKDVNDIVNPKIKELEEATGVKIAGVIDAAFDHLKSLVFYPEVYVGGVESIIFRPLFVASEKVEDTDNTCPITPEADKCCVAEKAQKFEFGNTIYKGYFPDTHVAYHVNPSALSQSKINTEGMRVTAHSALFRSTSDENPLESFTVNFNRLEGGKLFVDLKMNATQLFSEFKDANLSIPKTPYGTNRASFNGNGDGNGDGNGEASGGDHGIVSADKYCIFGYPDYFGVKNIGNFIDNESQKGVVLALQVPHSDEVLAEIEKKRGEKVDPFVTSDYTRVVIEPLYGIEVAKRDDKKSSYNRETDKKYFLSNTLGVTEEDNDFMGGVPEGYALLDNYTPHPDDPAKALDTKTDIRVIKVTDKTTVNLVDSIVALGVSTADAFYPIPVADYGFKWHFDLLDANDKEIVFLVDQNETNQQEFINLTDPEKGTVTSKVYSSASQNTAIGRSPVVRAQLVTEDGCAVVTKYIRVEFVGTTAEREFVFDLGKVEADGCVTALHLLPTPEMNETVLNKLYSEKEGITWDDFRDAYCPDVTFDQDEKNKLEYGKKVYYLFDTDVNGSNVTVSKLGSFYWASDQLNNPRVTYLPVWKLSSCDVTFCEGETSKNVQTTVTITPTKSGYPVLKFIYKATIQKPAFNNIGKTGLNLNYWNNVDSPEFILHNVQIPAGDYNPAKCTFRLNLNNAFTSVKDGLLDLGTDIPYKYSFAPAELQMPKFNGKDLTITVEGDGTILKASYPESIKVGGVDVYTENTDEVLATIERHGTPNQDPAGDYLIVNENSGLAKVLLNHDKHFMWAKLMLQASCCKDDNNQPDYSIPVIINNSQTFDVKFTRPIDASTESTEHYLDKSEKGYPGSFIDMAKLVTLTDWRGTEFSADDKLYKFYHVKSVTPSVDREVVMFDNNGVWTPISKSGIILEHLKKAEAEAAFADVDKAVFTKVKYKPVDENGKPVISTYGALFYHNNQASVVRDFKLRIPVTVEYKWGYLEVINLEVNVVASQPQEPTPDAGDGSNPEPQP